jgi:preprotein translocase subunit SecD
MLGTVVAGLVVPFVTRAPDRGAAAEERIPPTSTTPAVVIPPLAVRPVVAAHATTPKQCPAPIPSPLSDPLQTCDIDKTATYALGPTAMQLRLTGVKSVNSPTGDSYVIQVDMDAASSAAFADYTATHVGEQIAFVRDGVVVSAPDITQPIDAPSLQLSGRLTAAQADNIARMLRNEA